MPAKRRAKRRKNVQMGFWDGTGFHPIRASSDYDSGYEIRAARSRAWSASQKPKRKKSKAKRRKNPGQTVVRGWLKAKAVKIVRDKNGRAVKALIKT